MGIERDIYIISAPEGPFEKCKGVIKQIKQKMKKLVEKLNEVDRLGGGVAKDGG